MPSGKYSVVLAVGEAKKEVTLDFTVQPGKLVAVRHTENSGEIETQLTNLLTGAAAAPASAPAPSAPASTAAGS